LKEQKVQQSVTLQIVLMLDGFTTF
jgi:hypothetical protein